MFNPQNITMISTSKDSNVLYISLNTTIAVPPP
jgi:hypothetical protein